MRKALNGTVASAGSRNSFPVLRFGRYSWIQRELSRWYLCNELGRKHCGRRQGQGTDTASWRCLFFIFKQEVVELDAQTLPNTNSSIEAVLQRIFNKPESCILYLSYLPTDGKERVFLHPDYPKATITFLTQIDWLERPNPVTWHIHIIDTRSALEKLFSWAMSLVAEDWEKKEK